MIFIGIDPGNTGAIAFINELGNGSISIELVDAPTITMKSSSGKNRTSLSPAMMAEIVVRQIGHISVPKYCVIEKVSAAPIEGRQQGTTSMFNFGVGFGMWQGVFAGLQIPYGLVHPATWKSKMLKGMPKGKHASRERALQLYPQCASRLNLVKHDGRAEALLMAEYARLTHSSEKELGLPCDLFTAPVEV